MEGFRSGLGLGGVTEKYASLFEGGVRKVKIGSKGLKSSAYASLVRLNAISIVLRDYFWG